MTPEDSLIKPRIVCAANKTLSGHLVIGIRHYDGFMRWAIAFAGHSFSREDLDYQGFVDQFGKFYTRTEAWKVAEAAGQILHRCGGDTANGGTLFSENLY